MIDFRVQSGVITAVSSSSKMADVKLEDSSEQSFYFSEMKLVRRG